MSTIVKSHSSLVDYIQVLKPRETSLILFIGTCSALVAASFVSSGFPVDSFILTVIAIALGSAGANGLTNYLDRDVDARMRRTCNRVLPSKRIEPAGKVLPMIFTLLVLSLVLAWILSPVCFVIGLVGIITSAIWRKTISCTFFGIIAGSAPVLIGWYAIMKQPLFDLMPLLFFCLIMLWTPIHVWTLMIANRSDYESAGLHYFPLSWKDSAIVKMLAALSVGLAAVATLAYFLTGRFHLLYFYVATIVSLVMVSANLRLMFSPSSRNAWTVYKLSAFPYLCIIFTAMALDTWLS